MAEKKLSQKERVYRAVKKLLGEQFRDGMNVRELFLPDDPWTGKRCKEFPRGLCSRTENEDLFEAIIASAEVPRSSVFDALRRDPRLNGGKKRKWKTKGQRSYEQLKRTDYFVSWNGELNSRERKATTPEAAEIISLQRNLRCAHLLLEAKGIKTTSLRTDVQADIGIDVFTSSSDKRTAA